MITGAGSGLGRQLALDLFAKGMKLGLGDRDEAGLLETARLLNAPEGSVTLCTTDVTDPEQCRILVDQTLEKFGAIDDLILCAGISMWALFEDITDLQLFDTLMRVNYLGAVYCIHSALPALRKSRGNIVAISSLQGELGVAHHSGYAGAKHALNGFLESLDFELGDEIHILSVMPGWIKGTNLRASAFHSDGSELGDQARKHSSEAVTVEECSQIIIGKMRSKAKTVFIPGKLRYLALLKLVAPGLVKRIVMNAIKKQQTS